MMTLRITALRIFQSATYFNVMLRIVMLSVVLLSVVELLPPVPFINGATGFSRTTFGLMALSINDIEHNRHSASMLYIMLSVIMLNVAFYLLLC